MDQRPINVSAVGARRAHLAAADRSAGGPLLPLVRLEDTPAPAVHRAVSRAALAAAAGDRTARDTLFCALSMPISGYVDRYRRRARETGGVWDLDDVRQEAYLAFVETVGEWSGHPPFLEYFALRFPRRLADAVWRLNRRPRSRPIDDASLVLHDESAAAASLTLLESLAATLPEPDRTILLLLVRDELGLGSIAKRLGLSRRTVCRRWSRVREMLRESLVEGREA